MLECNTLVSRVVGGWGVEDVKEAPRAIFPAIRGISFCGLI